MATRILVVDDSPTIRSVVGAILARNGYEAEVAADGQDAYEALSTGQVSADLVLVDFVMPRMNGYQFCRALRENATLSAMPVILMSAKGDRIREQFVQQTGALDAITKPFDAQALVAVIENALRKMNTARASGTRAPEHDDVTRIGTVQQAVIELETRRTHVAQIIAQKLASIAANTLSMHLGLSGAAEIEGAIADKLSNEAILEMMEAVRHIGGSEGESALLSGDLGVVPVGAILQLLQAENQTGVLVCTSGDTEIRATFRGGMIDLVQSTGAGDEFRLGRFFIDEGILTAGEIEAVSHDPASSTEEHKASDDVMPRSAVHMREGPATMPSGADTRDEATEVEFDPPNVSDTQRGSALADITSAAVAERAPLGMRLLAAGKITEAELRTALTRQSSELLYEILRWPTGRFELRREAPSVLAENAKLGMPVASVVMEGFRRVDEWRALERTLGNFDAVLVRDDTAFGTLDVGSLPSRERAVLDVVDGERTIRGIVSASHLSSFDACRILVQFLEARVLRRRAA
jgi:DNA-binding response OmpR family regulator